MCYQHSFVKFTNHVKKIINLFPQKIGHQKEIETIIDIRNFN